MGKLDRKVAIITLDCLLNNAGFGGALGPIESIGVWMA